VNDDERDAWRELAAKPWRVPRRPQLVHPDPQSRFAYIRFATAAAVFFRGKKPVRFTGDHWCL
jgi:hypothetical protein